MKRETQGRRGRAFTTSVTQLTDREITINLRTGKYSLNLTISLHDI